jgi:glycosyltransferase involved in cell wall biosynthesis
MAMAIVDVLVPTYNRSGMLRRSLESIQTQTYSDIQVTIGDDCSDDDTRTVAQDFCATDGRFHYLRNAPRLGIFGNTNALFTHVTAPYVHFMHDDDWLEPCFYERMIAELEESPEVGLAWPRVILSQGGNETVQRLPDRFDHGQVLTGEFGLPERFGHDQVVPGETAFEELLHGNFITCPAVVLRTSVLREVGPFSEYLTGDWLMWLRIALHHDLKLIDAPLFHYRVHEEQVGADPLRMGRDVIDMFEFALGLEEFSDRQTEIVVARFGAVSRYLMGVKEEPHARRSIRELSAYFLRHVPDHHAAVRWVEMIALAYTVVPRGLRLRKGGRLRHWLRHLVLPWSRR